MRISDWSSDVCSSDLEQRGAGAAVARFGRVARPPVIADSRHPRRRARAEDADLHAPVFVNKVLKLRVVAAARSSILSPRKPARKCAVSTTKPGSPVLQIGRAHV